MDQLATKLGRPPGSFPAFERLTADQVAVLCELIDRACERRRRAVDAALEGTVPTGAAGRALVRFLRASE